MMSKNNFSERLRKMEPRKERFSIRKFSVGAASVLIGLTFLGMENQSVKADTVQPKVEAANTKVNNDAADVKDSNTQIDENKKATSASEVTLDTNNLETANNNTQHTIADSKISNEKNVSEVKDLSNNSQKDNNTSAKENASVNSESIKASDEIDYNALKDSTSSTHGVQLPEANKNGDFSHYKSMTMETDKLKASTDDNLKFKVSERHTFYPGINIAANTKNYRIRVQLDDRLNDYVKGVQLSQENDVNDQNATPIQLTRVAGTKNVWEANLVNNNKDADNQQGVIGSSHTGMAWTLPNCEIKFNDQLGNILPKIANLTTDPLVYGIYGYDTESKKQIGNFGSKGYIVNDKSIYDKPEATGSAAYKDNISKQPYFQGANVWVGYDKSDNSLHVFYNPVKLGAWSWTKIGQEPDRVGQLNYQIDPALVPYIKDATLRVIAADPKNSAFNKDGSFNFNQGKVWNGTFAIGDANSAHPGYGQVTINDQQVGNSNQNIRFGIGDSRNVALSEVVYHLNKPVNQIFSELAKNPKANVYGLQVGEWISSNPNYTKGTYGVAPNTQVTNAFDLAAVVDQNVSHEPVYTPVTVEQGKTAQSSVSYPLMGAVNSTQPKNVTYEISDPSMNWASIDSKTGTITVAPSTEVKAGMYNIPVTVTYSDKTVDDTFAPIYVKDANHNIEWGHDKDGKTTGAVEIITDGSALKGHETSDNSMNLADKASSAVKEINKYSISDNGSAVKSGSINPSDVKVSWVGDAPSTIIDTPSNKTSVQGQVKVDLGDKANDVLGESDKAITSDKFNINLAGASAKNVDSPVKVVAGSTKLSKDNFDKLIDHSELEKAGIKDYTYAWAEAPKVGDTQGTVRITFADKDSNGQNTYLDIKTSDNSISVKKTQNDSDKYDAKYGHTEVKPGEKKTIPSPSVVDVNGNPVNDVTPTYTKTTTTPSWATVKSDGSIDITAPQKEGPYTIPVSVTYPDGSTEITYAPVVVHDNDTKVDWHQDSATMLKTKVDTYHKTNDGSEPDPLTKTAAPIESISYTKFMKGDSVPKTFTYELSADGKTYNLVSGGNLNVGADNEEIPASFSADQIKTVWKDGFKANSDVSNFKDSGTGTSLAKEQLVNPNTEQRTTSSEDPTLAGNSKARVLITYGDQVMQIFGVHNYPDNWCNAYGNYYGATSDKTLTFKQGQDISNLTQDQYRQLINVTDLGEGGWNGQNINPNAPQILAYTQGTDEAKKFTMTWAPDKMASTAEVKNGVEGTVRISFNDGTYLDVVAHINVTPDKDAGKKDDQKSVYTQTIVYTYNKKEVAYTEIDNIKKGSNVSADQLKSAIDSNVPADYQIVKGYSYPAGLTNVTKTPAIIYVPLALKDGEADKFNAEGKLIYQTEDGKQVGSEVNIKSHIGDTLTQGYLHDLADQNVPANYVIAQYPGNVNVTKTGFVIPVIVKDGTKTINPGEKDATDDMFSNPTRTIEITNPDGTHGTQVQAVHFERSKTIDAVTGKTISYGDWKLAKGSDSDWSEWNVPQKDGYTSLVDGKPATKVGEQKVTAETKNVTVHVTYQANNNGDNTKPSQPTNPTNPTQPSSVPETPTPEPEQPSAPTQPTQASNDNKNVAPKPQKVDHKKSNGRAKTTSTTGLGNGERANRGNGYSKNVAPKSNASVDNGANAGNNNNGDKNAKTLPQTGEKQNKAGIFGLAFAGLAAMLGIAGDRKRNK